MLLRKTLGGARLAPLQLCRNIQPLRQWLGVGAFDTGEQLLNLRLLLRLDSGMAVRQRAVARGVGVQLGPIERHRAELQQLHLLGNTCTNSVAISLRNRLRNAHSVS